MGKKMMCPKGHLYDSNLPECPVCKERTGLESESKEIGMMETVREREEKISRDETAREEIREKPEEQPLMEHTKVVGKEEEKPRKEEKYRRKLVGLLVTYTLDKYGKVYELYEGRNQIGRKENNDIVIPEPIISQPHAMILYREGNFYIKDMASANGTQVNDNVLEPDVSVKLEDGDKITLAKIVEFYFRTCVPVKSNAV